VAAPSRDPRTTRSSRRESDRSRRPAPYPTLRPADVTQRDDVPYPSLAT